MGCWGQRQRFPPLDHPKAPTFRRRKVRRPRVDEVRQIGLTPAAWMLLLIPKARRRDCPQDVGNGGVRAKFFGQDRQPIAPDALAIATSEADDHVGVVAQAELLLHENIMGTQPPGSSPRRDVRHRDPPRGCRCARRLF